MSLTLFTQYEFISHSDFITNASDVIYYYIHRRQLISFLTDKNNTEWIEARFKLCYDYANTLQPLDKFVHPKELIWYTRNPIDVYKNILYHVQEKILNIKTNIENERQFMKNCLICDPEFIYHSWSYLRKWVEGLLIYKDINNIETWMYDVVDIFIGVL